MIYRFPKPWRYPQASFRSCVRIHHENANKNHAILGVPPHDKTETRWDHMTYRMGPPR